VEFPFTALVASVSEQASKANAALAQLRSRFAAARRRASHGQRVGPSSKSNTPDMKTGTRDRDGLFDETDDNQNTPARYSLIRSIHRYF
jgi:hypothetical protein